MLEKEGEISSLDFDDFLWNSAEFFMHVVHVKLDLCSTFRNAYVFPAIFQIYFLLSAITSLFLWSSETCSGENLMISNSLVTDQYLSGLLCKVAIIIFFLRLFLLGNFFRMCSDHFMIYLRVMPLKVFQIIPVRENSRSAVMLHCAKNRVSWDFWERQSIVALGETYIAHSHAFVTT